MNIFTFSFSDIGKRETNEDSIFASVRRLNGKPVCFAMVCDGVGGLSQGDFASNTAIEHFEKWFERDVINEPQLDVEILLQKFLLELKFINYEIYSYGESKNTHLGTTFSGILLFDKQFLIVHIGDTRIYFIDDSINQLTEDHTIAALKQRNRIIMNDDELIVYLNQLYQCIGAGFDFSPQIITGTISDGTFLMCSDGFRHRLSEHEMLDNFNKDKMSCISSGEIERNIIASVNKIKERGERDNISVIVINVSDTTGR